MASPKTVRAVDVGYGHVKFTDGHEPESNALRFERFPSQSPIAHSHSLSGGVMQSRDTFVVPVNDRKYEVGKGIARALHGNHESAVLDQDFALSDAYTARLYGALNYMFPDLDNSSIDFLVLGLPLNTYIKHHEEVSKRFTGNHVIDSSGTKIEINSCVVFPQPLGSYAAFLETTPGDEQPNALVIDVGFNTVDWFVCQGMEASIELSGAALRGMSAVLKAIAESIINTTRTDAGITELIRSLDRSMLRNETFTLFGKSFDLDEHMSAGNSVIEEAAQAIKNAIGSGIEIEQIIVSGGGGKFYLEAIKDKFPMHEIVLLDDPAYANVRGFQLMGELLAGSATRAVSGIE